MSADLSGKGRLNGDDLNALGQGENQHASFGDVTTDKLLEDLRTVVRDAEALLRATSTQTGERIQEVRARAQESLRQARVRLSEAEAQALERARQAATATEDYIRSNPWQSLGIAAGVGLVLGILFSRRS